MQRIRRSTYPSVFFSYFKIIDHVYETGFSKHDFHDGGRCHIETSPLICGALHYGRKNLTTLSCLNKG